MEFSFEQPRPQSKSAGGLNNSEQAVGSDRLRKAIERNRAKQAKRSQTTTRATRTSSPEDLFESDWNLPKSKPVSEKSASKLSASAASLKTRRSVGKAGEQEFTTEMRKRAPRSPSPVSYGATAPTKIAKNTPVPARTRKKVTTVKSLGTKGKRKRTSKSKRLAATNEYIIKGVWVFCALLFVRLIFSGGGVMDFYDKREVLQERFDEKSRIELENVALLKEIELLKKNSHYQKKVVRDHLGYIASDEYLILFPES